MQLGDAARQRQADAEAAERARQRLVLLREQLEGMRQELRVDALRPWSLTEIWTVLAARRTVIEIDARLEA